MGNLIAGWVKVDLEWTRDIIPFGRFSTYSEGNNFVFYTIKAQRNNKRKRSEFSKIKNRISHNVSCKQ